MFSCQDLQLFSLNSDVVRLPESVESVFAGAHQGPATERRAEGGAATRDGAKQTARAQSCGKGPRRLGRPAWIPLISTVGRTMETGEASVFTRAYEELYTSRALYHRLSSCSFPTPAKRPSHLWPGRTWHPAFYSTTLAGTRGHSGAESQRARGKESLF